MGETATDRSFIRSLLPQSLQTSMPIVSVPRSVLGLQLQSTFIFAGSSRNPHSTRLTKLRASPAFTAFSACYGCSGKLLLHSMTASSKKMLTVQATRGLSLYVCRSSFQDAAD